MGGKIEKGGRDGGKVTRYYYLWMVFGKNGVEVEEKL